MDFRGPDLFQEWEEHVWEMEHPYRWWNRLRQQGLRNLLWEVGQELHSWWCTRTWDRAHPKLHRVYTITDDPFLPDFPDLK